MAKAIGSRHVDVTDPSYKDTRPRTRSRSANMARASGARRRFRATRGQRCDPVTW